MNWWLFEEMGCRVKGINDKVNEWNGDWRNG